MFFFKNDENITQNMKLLTMTAGSENRMFVVF